MFGFKKQEVTTVSGIYGERTYDAAAEGEGYKTFSLPAFPEKELVGRIEQRTALLREKIEDGELDSANVNLICVSFANLLEELDAEIEAWKTRCEIGLDDFAADLRKDHMGRDRALSAVVEQAVRYGILDEGDATGIADGGVAVKAH